MKKAFRRSLYCLIFLVLVISLPKVNAQFQRLILGDVRVQGNFRTTGTLTVDGAQTLTGATTFTGTATHNGTLTTNANATFNPANAQQVLIKYGASPSVFPFTIQNSGGTDLAYMDTVGVFTTNSLVSNAATVTAGTTSARYIGSGSAPSIAAGAAAGTSPTVSAAGADTAHTVSVTAGTTPTTGTLVTLTFAGTYDSAPKPFCAPANINASANLVQAFVPVAGDTGAPTTTTYTIQVGVAPISTTVYKWTCLNFQ